MPKVTNPLFSGDARGKFGNMLIFARGGQVRIYFKPKNPNTAAQQAVRQAFKEFSVPGLTQEQANLLYAAILHLHDSDYAALVHGHDHGDLNGLGDDDHTQYLNQTRGDARYLQTVPQQDHGGLAGLADDDHTQYLNQSRGNALYSPVGHLHSDNSIVPYLFKQGGYYGRAFGAVTAAGLGIITLPALTVRYVPVSFMSDLLLANLTTWVATSGAGVTGVFGVYSNVLVSGSDRPNALLVTSGIIDMATGGLKTAAMPYMLQKGVPYWIAIMNLHPTTSVSLGSLGATSISAMTWFSTSVAITHLLQIAPSSALPLTPSSLTPNVGNAQMPAIFYT